MDHPERGTRSALCHGASGRETMRYKILDTVVLQKDLPEHGLCKGDLGAAVEVYEPEGVEVEFVTASGKTQALITLTVRDVRSVEDHDLVAVRSVLHAT